jgi:hypothetical protein
MLSKCREPRDEEEDERLRRLLDEGATTTGTRDGRRLGAKHRADRPFEDRDCR